MKLSVSAIKASAVLAAWAAGLSSSVAAQAGSDLYGWRGFYVGAAGTYSFINQDIKFRAPNTATGSASLDGVGGTGIVGYRIPFFSNDWRIGIEADGTVGDNRGGFNSYRFTSDFTATLRGTLGYHVHPDLLWFVTGGVGWMGIDSAPTGTRVSSLGTGQVLSDLRSSKTVFGGVVGTGFEWDMGRAIHLRGDYLYGSYEGHRADTSSATTGLVVSDKTINTDGHQLRLGVVVSLQNPYDEPHGRGDDIDRDRYARDPMK
jgi:opacity protein-like surface antigen